MGKTIEMTTYVTIGIHVVSEYSDGVNETYRAVEIDLSDDGEPGLWGDTYVRDDESFSGGEWVNDHQAQEVAWPMLENAIAFGSTKGEPTPDYDPNEVMEKLSSEDLIDVAWAVLEGGDPLAVALEIVSDMEDEDEG